MTSLDVRGVEKSFGRHQVLRGVDLSVRAGSLTAVLGPSGSGKTTLFRIIAGFERPDRGQVMLGGEVVDDGQARAVPAEARHIGYVPQEGALFPHLNVERNVAFGLPRQGRPGRLRPKRSNARVEELLDMVGLAGLGSRYPHQLSGGQQQRVALARALAVDPALVLLDEPFSSLDAGLRASVRADVQRVLREAGTTAVLVTHDQDEALSMADHVAVIRDGRIGQVDTPAAVYSRPDDAELARFLGEANLVAGTLEGSTVRTGLGSLALFPGTELPGTELPAANGSGRVEVLVRPEQLELLAAPAAGVVAARVIEYTYFGHDAVVRVQPDPATGLDVVLVRTTGGPVWEPGTEVGIRASGPVQAWPAPAQ